MTLPQKEYWFPAKRYGWGWGLPSAWQGWLVLAGYLIAVIALTRLFPPHAQPLPFYSLVTLATIALIFVCWLKGEPPRWRWGK